MTTEAPEHPAISTGDGPYLSVDHDEISFPVDRYTFNEARAAASSWAGELMGEWGRSRYVGKEPAGCHDHEDWEECYPDHRCCERMTWRFELYEGTYRG